MQVNAHDEPMDTSDGQTAHTAGQSSQITRGHLVANVASPFDNRLSFAQWVGYDTANLNNSHTVDEQPSHPPPDAMAAAAASSATQGSGGPQGSRISPLCDLNDQTIPTLFVSANVSSFILGSYFDDYLDGDEEAPSAPPPSPERFKLSRASFPTEKHATVEPPEAPKPDPVMTGLRRRNFYSMEELIDSMSGASLGKSLQDQAKELLEEVFADLRVTSGGDKGKARAPPSQASQPDVD